MSYIKTAGQTEDCIFCDLPAADNDEASLIVARGDAAFVILNKFPYNSGHLMIAPFRHTARFVDLTPDEHAEIASLTARSVAALEAAYQPEGFNLGMNMGRAGGAGIVHHLHQHVVPRWAGDANYMTTVGSTKVLPESLEQTYARLAPLLT